MEISEMASQILRILWPVVTVCGTCLDKGPSVDVANYRNIGVIMAEDSAYTVIGSLLDEVKIMREDCMHLM